MSWSNNVASVLVIIVSIVAVAGIAVSFAIFMQIFRQGGWKLAEPAIRKARWQMVRPWFLGGAVIGLLLGIGIVFLSDGDQTPPSAPTDAITSPPPEIKSQPREVPAVNSSAQTPAVPSEAKVSAVPDSAVSDTAQSASEDHERIQGTWDYVTLAPGPRDSIVFSQDKITFHVRDKTVAGTFVLDSTAQPKRIDLTFAGNPDGPVAPQGIYQFQKDLLVICLATTDGIRPTEFKSADKQNVIMLVRPTADSSGSDGRLLPGPADSMRGTVP